MSNKITYLDNAATTPTPGVVLDAMNKYYKNYRANVHRGVYDSAVKATQVFEASRASLASFINASPEEIIFNSGATFGLNQLAYSLSPRLSHRDNIVLTRSEHHANLVPWQQMAKHYGFEIRFIELDHPPTIISTTKEKSLSQSRTDRDSSGVYTERSERDVGMTTNYHLDINSAKKLIDANTKIVSLGLISNVTGTINPVSQIIKHAKKINKNIYTIVDAAQAVSHIPVDVKKLGCDFLVFSGHKMYGPTGIGVLYGKKELLNEHLEPFMFGGEMITSVTYDKAEWNNVPHKFEAGTPNIAGVIGLGAAVDYINKIGFKKIFSHEQKLTKQLINQLVAVGATIIGPTNNRVGVVSFTIPRKTPAKESRGKPNIHPHDLAEILDSEGVAIRAGYHCAEPLHTYLGISATARASIGIQNTEQDIKKLIAGIKKAQKIFS